MDNEENDRLNEIYREVEDSHAQLGIINERTRNIEGQIENLSGEVSENRADINDLEDDVKRNSTIITGVTGGVSMVLLWVSDKITRLF